MSKFNFGDYKEQDDMKVLICVPRTQDGGGANYFNALKNLFSIDIKYFYRGKPNWPISEGPFSNFVRITKDYFQFIKVLIKFDYEIIHINTHFGGLGLYRDLLFLLIAKTFKRKVIWFFHGWRPKYLSDKKSKLHNPLKKILFKADAFITLSNKEKNKLISWDYDKKIYVETTTVDKNLVKNVTEGKLINKYTDIETLNLLFLSRVVQEKGIYETINAFDKINKEYKNIHLAIAGKGEELNNLKEYTHKKSIENVSFKGFVEGESKIETFWHSHIFILPTYSEGMPNAVLEAFAFGLPVITTNVGGLSDIFREPENGFFVQVGDEMDLAIKLNKLIANTDLLKRISLNNYSYARNNFLSPTVAKRLENIYQEIN